MTKDNASPSFDNVVKLRRSEPAPSILARPVLHWPDGEDAERDAVREGHVSALCSHHAYTIEAAMAEVLRREREGTLARAIAAAMVATPAASPAEMALTTDLFAQWKGELGSVVSEKWWVTRGYHYAHIAKHFESLVGLASDALHTTFKNARLAKCSRETHKKERGTLAALFEWIETKPWGFMRPALPKLGKKDKGTRDARRKSAEVPMSEAEVEALIANLPEQTSKRGRACNPFRPIRDAVLVEWDTSLRPITIERLRLHEHWQPERPNELFIAAAIDKEGYERTIPLTPRLAALFQRRASALPDGQGPLLGPYQSALRSHWYAAAKAAGIDERRAKKISVYDFRHAAGKRLIDATGNIRGAAYMLGHRNATSTHRYTKPDEAAGRAAIDALARRPASESGGPGGSGLATLSNDVDNLQARDYMSVLPREGGGIGRRTSLRC